MTEIEYELTFLIKKLPADLNKFPSKIVADNYLPHSAEHPILRLRRSGEKYEITKKFPIDSGDDKTQGDSSRQIENTIPLTREEYEFLNSLDGKRVIKRRFMYQNAEIDVFLGELSGLALADFEFATDAEMQKFAKPDWCGADLSQEKMTAGGVLAGKSFVDVADDLSQEYNYKPLKNIKKYEEKK